MSHADSNKHKDAFVFIPGLDRNQSSDGIALRIASGLDRNAKTPQSSFRLKIGSDEDYDTTGEGSLTTRVRTVFYERGESSRDVADIYEFRYYDALTQKYADGSDLRRAFRLLIVLVVITPSLLTALFRRSGKSLLQKIQVIIGLGILGLFVLYFFILLFAIYGLLVNIPEIKSLFNANSTVASPGASWGLVAQAIVVIAAVLEAFKPSFKQSFSLAAQRYLSMVEYIRAGSRASVLSGQLEHLLDHIQAKDYARVIVIGYSFGSIIALDNFFPRQREPATRIRQVDTFITIGSPFEILRVFWPKYFTDRHIDKDITHRWINVFSPDDILGSDITERFPIQSTEGEAQGFPEKDNRILFKVGPLRRRYSLLDTIVLAGLDEHTFYWGDEFEFERSVFDDVVNKVYQDHDILN